MGGRVAVLGIGALRGGQLPRVQVEGGGKTGGEAPTGHLGWLAHFEHQHIALGTAAQGGIKDAISSQVDGIPCLPVLHVRRGEDIDALAIPDIGPGDVEGVILDKDIAQVVADCEGLAGLAGFAVDEAKVGVTRVIAGIAGANVLETVQATLENDWRRLHQVAIDGAQFLNLWLHSAAPWRQSSIGIPWSKSISSR